MPYSIRLPDGRIVGNIPDEIRPEEAKRRIIAAGLATDEPVAPEEEASARKKGLLASAVKGAENVIGSTTTAVKSVTGSPEEAALEGLQRQKEAEGKYEDVVSLEKVKEAYRKSGLLSAAGEAISQVPYALAEQAANIGVSVASGAAGAKLGFMAGSPLGPAGAGAGAIVGGLTGAFLPSFAQQYGGNIERQAAEQQKEGKKVEIDRGKAAAAGAVQGAAETAATLIPLGRTVVGKALGPEVEALLKAGKKEAAEQLAKESLAKVVAKGAATTAAVEVPTEVFQSALERAQAGLSLTSNEALAEYGEAAYQAGLISPIGAGGRYIDRSAARQEITGAAGAAGAAGQEYAPVEELKAQRAAAIAEARAKRDAEAEAALEPEEGEAAKAAEATTTTEEGAPPPPPSGIITADQLKTLGLKKNFGVHNRILGKDVNDPEQRDFVIANIDDYIKNNRGSEESRAALGEYRNILAGMSEAKDAGEAVTETGGVGVSVAGEPGAGATPGEPGASVPGGMVPPTEDAEPTDRGARQQPGAVASVQRARPSGAEAFEPELIEKLRTPDYKSREKLIEMPIDDFLALAKDANYQTKLRGTRKLLEEGTKFYSLPFLNVEDSGQVTGHEGRHRALALKEAGYDTMPVILRSANIRWSEQSDPDRFDYQEKWPTKLLAETGAKDKGFSVPFPVTREEATAPYQSGAVASVRREAPETPVTKQNLYHRSSMPELLTVDIDDVITLNPGPQGAEGSGVYFSEGKPVKPSTAEGIRSKKETGVIEIVKPSAKGWWQSKGAKETKFGKPRTWHTEGKPISLQITGIREENGTRIISATPVSSWISRDTGDIASVRREAPETPEFKSWFGDSKIVDEAGKPLVVYHGTNADITEFRPSKFGSLGEGIYFTSDPKAASNFATGVRGSRTEAELQGNVVPTYLSIEQPFDDNFFVGNKDWQDWVLSKVVGGDINNIPSFMLETMHGGVPREYLKELIDKLQSGTATISDITFIDKTDREAPWKHEIFDAVKKHGGFDGIVLKGSPKGFDEYLVFDPTKIKSAIGNVGTYSPETGDITSVRREVPETPVTKQNLYHRSSMPELLTVDIGDVITLNPGPQGAEGSGVYFSEGKPVKPSTAEGIRSKKETGVIEIVKPSPKGWWQSKGAKETKFGKPRTWHTEGKPISLQITGIREENGTRIISATPVSSWVYRAEVEPREDITKLPAFKRWFGKSKIVDSRGRPKVMYHGTARDISIFRPKQANAIFVTEDPDFAEEFSRLSENYIKNDLLNDIRPNPEQRLAVVKETKRIILKEYEGLGSFDVVTNLLHELTLWAQGYRPTLDGELSDYANQALENLGIRPTTGRNIMPVYVSAQNPFDYQNKEHVNKIEEALRKRFTDQEFVDILMPDVILGNWNTIENDAVQEAIKKAGFDGFYVTEGGRKNLAVYEPNQIKSATGNRGTYSPETGDITKTERAPGALRGAVIPELVDAAEKGDTRSALNIIAEHRKTSELDKLVARRLRQMSTLPRIEVAPANQVKGDAQYDTNTDTVRIAEGQVDSHTVLHEITHGALHKLILLNMEGKRNDPGYNDLKKLYEHIQKERPDLSKTYGMTDVSEFASEAMSNPEFQDILSKIEYKAQTALQWFGKAVRKLLGIPQREESALTEALIAIDKTIFEGRRVQRTEGADAGVLPVQRRRVQAPPVTPAPAPAGAQPPAAPPPPAAPGAVPVPPLPPRQPAPGRPARLVGEPETLSAVGKVSAALGPNKVVGLRTKFADSLAGQENVFSRLYRNRIKDNLGDYNPILLLSRAIDNARFALEALRTGTAVLRPGGLVEVTELKYGDDGRTISYEKDVAESIVKEAKRRGLETKEFHRYVDDLLAAHREYELMNSPQAADIDFFYTPQEATALEQQYRNDAYVVELNKIMDAIRFSGIDLMVATQRITPEQAKIWKDNSGYVPFNRIDKFDAYAQAMSSMRTQKSGVAAYKQLKPYSGSEAKQVSSPTESFAKTFEWMIRESMKNEASRRALMDLEMLNLAEYVPTRAAEDLNKRGAIVDTYVNGVKKSFYVPDPALYAGFLTQEREVTGVMAGLQSASRILRTGVTIMPPFAIKQIVDDVTRAYVYSGVKNPLPMVTRALMSMPVNWFNEIRGKQSASVRELSKLGIIATYDYSGKTNIKDIFEETGLEKRSLGQKIYRVLEAGAKASDISIRESIYNQILKETGDKAYAEHQAREIINFSRRGSARIMDIMIRVVPFFNAYARGMDKLAMAASGNNVAQKALGLSTTGAARTMFRNRMMMLTAMGFIYAWLMQDDEEYQKLDDHVRDRNWILPAGKEFVEKYGFVPAISIPAELAFFFKAIPERVFQMYKLQGTDQERDTMTVAKELFLNGVDVFSSPNVTPQLLKPIFENIVNYSFFLGRPLESQMQLNYRPVAREGRGTSEIAKELAQALDAASVATGIEGLQTSPIKIDNLLRGLFGTTAGTVMAFTDAILNPSRTDRPLHQQLATQLTGASAFMKDGVGTRFISDIYKLEKSVEQAGKTFDLYVKRGEVDKAQDVLQANYGLIATRAYVRELMQTLRTLNRMASDIDKATSMTPEERRKALNEFVNVQNELAKEVYRARHMVSEIQQQMDRGLTGIPSKSSTPSKAMPPEPRYPGAETAEVSEEEDEE